MLIKQLNFKCNLIYFLNIYILSLEKFRFFSDFEKIYLTLKNVYYFE